MNITAKLFKNEGDGKQKAYGSIMLDDCFVVQIRVMEGKNGVFVSFPNRKLANGEYKDVAFPITKEARQQIIDVVLGEYEKLNKPDNATQENDLEDEFPF